MAAKTRPLIVGIVFPYAPLISDPFDPGIPRHENTVFHFPDYLDLELPDKGSKIIPQFGDRPDEQFAAFHFSFESAH